MQPTGLVGGGGGLARLIKWVRSGYGLVEMTGLGFEVYESRSGMVLGLFGP